MNLIQLFSQLLGSGKSQLNTANLTKEGKIDDAFAKLLTEKGFDKKDIAKITQLLESQKNERKAFVNKAGIEVSIEYPIHLIKKQQSQFDGLKEQIAKLPNASEIQETGKPIDLPTKENAVKSPTKVVIPQKESISSLNAKYHILAENAKQTNQNAFVAKELKAETGNVASDKSTLFDKKAKVSTTDAGQVVANRSVKDELSALKMRLNDPQKDQVSGSSSSDVKVRAEKNNSAQATAENGKKTITDDFDTKIDSKKVANATIADTTSEVGKSALKNDSFATNSLQSGTVLGKSIPAKQTNDKEIELSHSKNADRIQPRNGQTTDEISTAAASATASILGSASISPKAVEQNNETNTATKSTSEPRSGTKVSDSKDFQLKQNSQSSIEANQADSAKAAKTLEANVTAATTNDIANRSEKEQSLKAEKMSASAELTKSAAINDLAKKAASKAEMAINSELGKNKLAASKASLLKEQDTSASEATKSSTNKHKQSLETGETAAKTGTNYEVNRSKIDSHSQQINAGNMTAKESKLAQPKVRFISSEKLTNSQNEIEKPTFPPKNIVSDSVNKKAETVDTTTAPPKEASTNKLWNENSWNVESSTNLSVKEGKKEAIPSINQSAKPDVSASEELKKGKLSPSVNIEESTNASTKQQFPTNESAEQAKTGLNATAKESSTSSKNQGVDSAANTGKSLTDKNHDFSESLKTKVAQETKTTINASPSEPISAKDADLKQKVVAENSAVKTTSNKLETDLAANINRNETPVLTKNEQASVSEKNAIANESANKVSTNQTAQASNTDTTKLASNNPLGTSLTGEKVVSNSQKPAINWGANWGETSTEVVAESNNKQRAENKLPKVSNENDKVAIKSAAVNQEPAKQAEFKTTKLPQSNAYSIKSAEDSTAAPSVLNNPGKEAQKAPISSTVDQANSATNKTENSQRLVQKAAELNRQVAVDTERIATSTKVEQQAVKEAFVQTDAKKAEAKSQANISANQAQQFEIKQELNQIKNDRQNTAEAKDFDNRLTTQQRKNDADFQKNNQQNQQQSQQFGSQLNKNAQINAAKESATNGLSDFKQQLEQTNFDFTSANSLANANKGIKTGKEMEVQKVQETIVNQLRYTESTEWNKQRIVMDDGSSLRFNIRKVGETLQLQLIGPQSELNKMVQLNAGDIKAHLEQQLGLKVDLQFSQSDGNDQQSNQRNDSQNLNGSMNGNTNNFGNGQNLTNQNNGSSSANNASANEGEKAANADLNANDQKQNPIDGWVG